MLALAAAMFGQFFFLTLFVQDVPATARSRPASPSSPSPGRSC
jgi:hypothetical protein